MSLQSSFYGTATVDGTPLGGFQTFTGGEVTAETVKDRPPTGNDIDQPQTGPRTITNVIMSRTYDIDRDGALLAFLESRAGHTKNIAVARHPMDADGNPKGTDRVYSPCVLVRVAGPAANRNATGDKATLELEFAVGGIAG